MNKFLIFALFLSGFALCQNVQIGVPTVAGGSVSSVTTQCTPVIIAVGQTAQCSASAFVSGQPSTDVTNSGIWSSLKPTVATVSNSGLVTGVSGGAATISFNFGESAFVVNTTINVGTPPVILTTGMTGCPPPNGTGTQCTLPSGAVNGSAYSYQFTGTGGVLPYSWTIDASTSTCLSGSGFTLSSAGLFSATSAVTGTYTCLVDLTDSEPVTNSLSVQIVVAASGGGPPNYLAYQGPLIIPPGVQPNIGGLTNNGAAVTDISYQTYGGVPTANLTTVTRCTDSVSGAGVAVNQTYQAGQGGSGSGQVCNFNGTICRIEDTFGHARMTMITGTPKRCTAPTANGGVASGIFVTLAQNTGTPGSNAVSTDFGSGSFDLQDPTVYWAFSNNTDITSLTALNKYVWNTSTGAYTVPTSPTVDFIFGLPVGTTNAPEHSFNSYVFGNYVTHTLKNLSSGSPEYLKWSNTTTYAIGDLIVPGDSDGYLNNPLGCAFKAIAAGTPGATEPNFNTASSCSASTISDGSTLKWKGIGSPAQFVLQVVSNLLPCSPAAASAFAPYAGTPPLHPNLGSLSTETGQTASHIPCTLTWQNVGPDLAVITGNQWSDGMGRVASNQTSFGAAISTNMYGGQCDPKAGCPTLTYNLNAAGGQGSAFYAIMAKTSDPITLKPTYYLLNTVTGIQTNFTCNTGTLGTCGSITASTPGTVAFNYIINWDGKGTSSIGANNGTSYCSFSMHGAKMHGDGTTIDLTYQAGLANPGVLACQNGVDINWRPFDTFDANKNVQVFSGLVNHGGEGQSNRMSWRNGGYGFTSGVQMTIYPDNNASGNFGGLPPGCGSNTSPCILFSGATQPVFNLPPYSFSIASNCQSTQNTTNTGYNQQIASISGNGTTATVTLTNSAFVFPVNAVVSITGVTGATGLNAQNVTVATSSAGTFTYANMTNANGTVSSKTFAWDLLPSQVYGTLPVNYGTAGNFGAPDCNIATSVDNHPSWAYNPGLLDNGVSLGSIINYATLSPVPFSQNMGEEVGMTLTAACTPGTVGSPPCQPPISVGKQYRFFHAFDTGTNPIFGTQFAISQASQDGTFGMWSTDWMCTLGATTGASGAPIQDGSGALGHVPVNTLPASATSFCGPPWQSGWPFFLGNMISAIQGTTGGGSKFDVFQAVQVNGPSSNCAVGQSGGTCGTPVPTWKACTTQTGGCSAPPTASTSVTAASWASGTATITTAAAAILGQTINVSGMNPSGYNCTATTCLITAVGSGTLSYAIASNPGAFVSGGSAYGVGTQFCDSQASGDTLPTCASGIVWQDVGKNNARGDVVLATLK